MPQISGVTKDALGVPVSAVVDVHRSDNGALVERIVSDPVSGAYLATTADDSAIFVTRHIAPVVPGDADWDSVALALRMTALTPDGKYMFDEFGHTLATHGVSVATPYTEGVTDGGPAAYFDGGSHISAEFGNDLDCGVLPFTLRGKIRHKTNPFTERTPTVIANNAGSVVSGCSINVDHYLAPGKLSVCADAFSTSSVVASSTIDVVPDTWYDFEVSRDGTTLRIILDGSDITTAVIPDTLEFNWGLGGLRIGGILPIGGGGSLGDFIAFFAGYMKDIFLFKNIVRHTAAFTPPTAFVGGPSPGTPTSNAQVFDNVIPGRGKE